MMLSRWMMTGTSSPRLSRMNQGSLCSLCGRLTSRSSHARPFSAITSRTCRGQGQSGEGRWDTQGHSAQMGLGKWGGRSEITYRRGHCFFQPILGPLGRGAISQGLRAWWLRGWASQLGIPGDRIPGSAVFEQIP